MKKTLFLVAAIAAAFTSCSKDDDGPKGPTPPAFKVEIQKAIEGDWNNEIGDYDYTYKTIDSVIFASEDDGYFQIRIKADVDWVVDQTSIPAIFDAYGFTDDDDNAVGAKANEYSQIMLLEIADESKLETLPSIVTFKIKDKATSKTVDVVVKLTGVGDSFIVRSDDGEYDNKVGKTGVNDLVFQFSHSPAYDFKVVAMKGKATSGTIEEIKEADWVTVTRTVSKAALAKATITCKVKDNSGEPRGTELYAIPKSASVTDVFFYNEQYEQFEIKPEYEKKAFSLRTTILQDGNVALKFSNGTNALTKSYSASKLGTNGFNPGEKIALNTTAYCGDGPDGGIMLKKGITLPDWILWPYVNNTPKEFWLSISENTTGSSRTAVLEFYYYASSSDTGTKVGTLTVEQAAN